jgi:peroxiredoxin Q/BCP
MKLNEKDAALDFNLPDQDGKIHKLSDYKGRWLLLYFYPKDFTPGCITEACSFRDNFSKLKERMEIVGVSADDIKSHKKFVQKYNLPFTILSDDKKKTIKDYGTDGLIFARRTSFLINPEGVIEKIYEKVDPSTHVDEIFKDINQFDK